LCLLVSPIVGFGPVAHSLAVLPRLHGNLLITEDLVFVMVNGNVLRIVVGWSEEAVISVWRVERIVEDDSGVADYPYVPVSVTPKLFQHVHIQLPAHRLVQQLDTDDHVLVLLLSILVRNCAQHIQGTLDGIILAESQGVRVLSFSRVVESVLRAGRTVQVNEDFKTSTSCPVDSSIDVLCGALYVWRACVVVGPKANWYPDEVEARRSNLLEVAECCPCVPMLAQNGWRVVG